MILRPISFSPSCVQNNILSISVLILSLLTCHLVSSAGKSPPLIVRQPPSDEILFQVADNADENQKPFIIPCEAEAYPEPRRYKWIKDGKEFNYQLYDTRISRQLGRGTLVFTQPKNEDAGQYQCLAINENGVAMSNSVFVRKAEFDSFKDQEIETITADEGKPFKLPCNAPDGYPKPEVSWKTQSKFGAIKSINSSRLTTDPEGTLWFSGVTKEDRSTEFYFSCVAFSRFRNEYKIGGRVYLSVAPTSTSTSLIKYPPTLQYISKRVTTALRGEDIELWCIVGGIPLPEIKWSRQGGLLPSDLIVFDNYGKTLRILKVNFSDEDTYYCNASNGVGSQISYTISLVVNAAPYFTVEPEIVNTAEDETVEFRCEAAGKPAPEIKWIHNGKPIEQAAPNSRRIVETNKITLGNVHRSDTGNYGCNASNSFGYVYKEVYVNVLTISPEITSAEYVPAATKITFKPDDYEVQAGFPATLTCLATSDPTLTLTIEWMSNGELIDFESEPRYEILQDNSLKIHSTTELDSGVYTCVAKTAYDNATASANLIVQDIPNRPELLNVDCGRKDARLWWKPMGDNRSPILHYTIQYNTSFTPDSWEIAFEDIPSTETRYDVSMSPWSNYTFRVIARNKIGPSLPSSHSPVCHTPVNVPSKNPDDVKVDGTEPNTVRISWTRMPEIEHNAPKFEYHVFWKQDDDSQWKREEINDWKVNELIILNQPTYQPYLARVLAVNEQGESNVSPTVVRGFSAEDYPSEAPTNFTVLSKVDGKTLLVEWNPVPPESLNGKFVGYKIQTWTDAEKEENAREIMVNRDVTKALVDKLIPVSRNLIRVLAHNTAYNGPPSNVIEIVNDGGTPDAGTTEEISIASLERSTRTCTEFDFSREEQNLNLNILKEKLEQLQLERVRATIVYEEQMKVLDLQRNYWSKMSSLSGKCSE